ncbi:unnamed protein product, partial [Brenthis ino]
MFGPLMNTNWSARTAAWPKLGQNVAEAGRSALKRTGAGWSGLRRTGAALAQLIPKTATFKLHRLTPSVINS